MPKVPLLGPIATEFHWNGSTNLPPRKYDCAHCGGHVATNLGLSGSRFESLELGEMVECLSDKNKVKTHTRFVYICHLCKNPTFFDENGNQYPNAIPGRKITGLKNEVQELYEEARSCFSVSAYTAASMALRKLLMNIAVDHGADESLGFKDYVDFINKQGLVPYKCKFLIEEIRKQGNAANHEIRSVTEEEATVLLELVGLLLMTTYDIPTRYKKQSNKRS